MLKHLLPLMQWSPVDPCVLASCSVDGSIKIWDTRKKRSPTATIKAYKTDVNVISWNRYLTFMLLLSISIVMVTLLCDSFFS